ncbi:MAG: hypothetical protein FWF72_00530 [Paludibacter sp.]|nr:hypothetical protein [Paludibacter sp.]
MNERDIFSNRFSGNKRNYGGNTVEGALQNRQNRVARSFDGSQAVGLFSSNGEEVLEMHIQNTGEATKRIALFGGQFTSKADLNAAFGETVDGIIGLEAISNILVDNATALKNAAKFFCNVPVLAQQLDFTVDTQHLSQLSKSIKERRYYPLRDLGSRDIVLQTKVRTTQQMPNKIVVQPNISFNNQTVLIMDIIGGADVTLIWTIDGSVNIPQELEKAWANGLV